MGCVWFLAEVSRNRIAVCRKTAGLERNKEGEGEGCTGGGNVEGLRLDVDSLGEDADTGGHDGHCAWRIADAGEAKLDGSEGLGDDAWGVGEEDGRSDGDLVGQQVGDDVREVALGQLLEAGRLSRQKLFSTRTFIKQELTVQHIVQAGALHRSSDLRQGSRVHKATADPAP